MIPNWVQAYWDFAGLVIRSMARCSLGHAQQDIGYVIRKSTEVTIPERRCTPFRPGRIEACCAVAARIPLLLWFRHVEFAALLYWLWFIVIGSVMMNESEPMELHQALKGVLP